MKQILALQFWSEYEAVAFAEVLPLILPDAEITARASNFVHVQFRESQTVKLTEQQLLEALAKALEYGFKVGREGWSK